MENFPYTLFENSHTNPPKQAYSETAHEVRIDPAGLPVLLMAVVYGGAIAVTFFIGMSSGDKEGAFWWTPLNVAGVLCALAIAVTVIRYRRESERGPVFLLDRRTGRYSFPRWEREGPAAELVETALVECLRDRDGNRMYELQLLLRRGNAPPDAMLLAGCTEELPLTQMQKKLTAALKLPARRVRVAT